MSQTVHMCRSACVRALCVLLAAAALASAPSPAFAARAGTDLICGVPLSSGEISRTVAPSISGAAGILVAPDGRAIWARKADEDRAMASTTKLMTALVVLERADLDGQLTVSKAASRVPYAVGLQPGERLSVRHALELLLVTSSNDAARALAEHVSGSQSAFVSAMNARADQLGMDDTHFANPHGLDAKGHHSSAADLAVLARTVAKLPEYERIEKMRSVTLAARKDRPARTFNSTDELLGRYRGLNGGKTGFTDDAKYCFVASASRDGVALTAVILGAKSSTERFKQAAKLLDWGFEHVNKERVASATQTVGSVAIAENPSRTVAARIREDASATVVDLDGPVTQRPVLQRRVSLPVFEGQSLGEVHIVQGDRVLTKVPVVAAASAASAEQTVGAVPVSDYIDRTVVARAGEVTAPVPAYDASAPVSRLVNLTHAVAAPVDEGQRLGEIVYSQGGRVIVRVPVVAATAAEQPGLLGRAGIGVARLFRRLVGAPLVAEAQVLSE